MAENICKSKSMVPTRGRENPKMIETHVIKKDSFHFDNSHRGYLATIGPRV